jgi:GNAT superfamily N-acetyltransferase
LPAAKAGKVPASVDKTMLLNLEFRPIDESDPERISSAFCNLGWRKPVAQYRRYLEEQQAGTRTCFIAELDCEFAGYVTLNWSPSYRNFAERAIPEIQDLNVLPQFRRRGIGGRLLDGAEQEARKRSSIVGIGVGLHPGYGSAQKLYVKRGYVPDGRGVYYRNQLVEEGAQVVFDDDLVIYLTKRLE